MPDWKTGIASGIRQMCCTCALLACVLSTTRAWALTQRPNIVFIFSDDHAVQAIGAYGSRINETPNIDRIAREGAVFTNSFCANSLCGPSRACILTGKHSHLNGFLRNGNRFDGRQTTFPPLLQQAGYQTAVIGKWHLGTDPVGFDHWEILPGQGSYYNPDFIQMDGSRRPLRRLLHRHHHRSFAAVAEGRNEIPDKPFVLMCQHKAPHRNWAPPTHAIFSSVRRTPVPEPRRFAMTTRVGPHCCRKTKCRFVIIFIGVTT